MEMASLWRVLCLSISTFSTGGIRVDACSDFEKRCIFGAKELFSLVMIILTSDWCLPSSTFKRRGILFGLRYRYPTASMRCVPAAVVDGHEAQRL